MKKIILSFLILLFCISTSNSAELRKFNKIDENQEFIIQNGDIFKFGDSLIFSVTILTLPDSTYRPAILTYYNDKFDILEATEYYDKDTTVEASLYSLNNFIKDSENNFWFTFSQAGLYKLEGTEVISYYSILINNGIKYIVSMAWGNGNNMYWSAPNGNLYKFNIDSFQVTQINDFAGSAYFNQRLFGSKLMKFKDKVYFLNRAGTFSYIDPQDDSIDTLSLQSFVDYPIEMILTIKNTEKYLYFIYYGNNGFHLAKYDGNNLINLDDYYFLLNDGKPSDIKTYFNIDEDENFYFKYPIVADPDDKRIDSIFVIDKNYNKTSIYYHDLNLRDAITLSSTIKMTNGEIFINNGADGFIVISNPTSVEAPRNLIFLSRTYPNPAKDYINIDFSVEPINLPNTKVKIYDYIGREVSKLSPEVEYNNATGIGKMTCDISDIQRGFYILVITNDKYSKSTPIYIE